MNAQDCGTDSECRTFACETGACATQDAPFGSPCTQGGEICDGIGNCVPGTCVDNVMSGSETDVDCGGKCPPCENDDHCITGDDCISGFCNNGDQGSGGSGGSGAGGSSSIVGWTCQPCAADDDCNANGDWYCHEGVCIAKGELGDSCGAANECLSGSCVDGVCCDTGCSGACEACNLAGLEGTCSPEASGTACGAPATAECDGADTCDGAGTCLPNHVASGTACGDASVSECTAADTCDGGGSCVANHAASGTACGDQNVVCHVNDSCDGSGSCQDNGFALDGSACGDPTSTECSAADSCLAGACMTNHVAAGSPCGDQGVACVVNDVCNDNGTCLDNGFVPAGTACGNASDTECTDPDTCSGTGSCVANDAAAGAPCGDQGVECHVNDGCSGSGFCVNNGFSPTGTACGDPTSTDCNQADSCNNNGNCVDNLVPAGTPCTEDGFFCNGAELCNGGGACTSPGDPCFLPEQCFEYADMCMVPTMWINEFHYDNIGTDVGEFVEVAVQADTDVSSVTVTLYDGAGSPYGVHPLSTFTQGNTVNNVTFYFKMIPGIQNGNADGIALDNAGALLHFISYEGAFTAHAGVANGVTSTNIPVFEDIGAPIGSSLGLTGTGNQASDFVWTHNQTDSPGDVNFGQIIQ